jgi:hypothetical protein
MAQHAADELFAKAVIEGTSITSPGLTRFGSRLLLGWTGTDQDNTINFAGISSDTTDETVHGSVTTETSMDAPAFASTMDGEIFMSWLGQDGRINVSSTRDGGNNWFKKTLDERCVGAPALAYGLREKLLYLAFTENNVKQNISLMFSPDGANFGAKLTIDEMTSYVAPALVWMDGALFLAFTGMDNRLNAAQFGFRGNPKLPLDAASLQITHTILEESSDSQPSLAAFDFDDSLFLAWTGRDYDHHLNLCNARAPQSAVPLAFGPKRTFTDEGFGGPATVAVRDMLFIAWTGRDDFHTVNLARAI